MTINGTKNVGADATRLFTGGANLTKYDIPLDHLDFKYVASCKDVKELEKIYRILKSGEEGNYPDLEQACEKRISEISPNSRVLRKDHPVKTKKDLDQEEMQKLEADLEDWSSQMKSMDNACTEKAATGDGLPPIRGSGTTASINVSSNASKKDDSEAKKNKRVKPRDYREWDKFDIEAELEKADQEEMKKPAYVKPKKLEHVEDTIPLEGMSPQEIQRKADMEKDKGNEYFTSQEYDAAILYYSRSLSLIPSAASFNNRALAYLKLEKWAHAVEDCNKVLKMEDQNIKALLRRGSAYKGKQDYERAIQDFKGTLEVESHNARAQKLLEETEQLLQKQKEEQQTKGRRMVIEEVEGSEESDIEEIEAEPAPPPQAEGKKGRKMEIEEVENSDSDDADLPSPGEKVNGHSDKPKSDPLTETVKTDEASNPNENPETENVPLDNKLHNTERTCENTESSEGQTEENSKENSKSTKENSKENSKSTKENSKENSKSTKENSKENSKSTKENSKENSKSTKENSKENSKSTKENSKSTKEDSKENSKSTEANSKERKSEEKASQTHLEPKDAQVEPKPDETVIAGPKVIQPVNLPMDILALKTVGNDLFRAGQYGEAHTKYTKAIHRLCCEFIQHKDDPQFYNVSVLLSNRAACRIKNGDARGCIEDCDESLRLVPHSIKPLLRKAQAYELLEKYREAYVNYRHILSIDWTVDVAHQGSSRCGKMLFDEDGPGWREKLPPSPVVKPSEMTVVATPAAQIEEEKRYQFFMKEKENISESERAEETPKLEQTTEQVKSPEEKPAEQIKNPEERFLEIKNQGATFVQKQNFKSAMNSYTTCIEIFPDRAVSYTNRALCHLRLDKAVDAINDCTKALELEPDNVKAYFRRAQAKKMLKFYKGSMEDLLHLLKIDSKNASARKELDIVQKYYKEELLHNKKVDAEKSSRQKSQGKQRKKLVIEEVNGSSDEDKEKVDKKSTPPKKNKPDRKEQKTNPTTPSGQSKKKDKQKEKTPPQAPKLSKKTPYEFMQAWNSLKKSQDVEQYAKLIEQIRPQELPKLISNKLESDMLTVFVKCVHEHFIKKDASTAYSLLFHLQKVERFKLQTMFVPVKDKEMLDSIFTTLSSKSGVPYSQKDVNNLKEAYGC